MLSSFPPYFFVLVFGLMAGGASVVIVLIVFLVKHLSNKREQPYEVETSVRIVAFLIDLYIISIIYLIVQAVINVITYGNMIFLLYLLPNIIFQAAYNVISLLFNPFLLIIQMISYPPYIPVMLSNFYLYLP